MMLPFPFYHPALDELAAFTDGELAPQSRERLARHLRACPRCQASLRFVRQVDATAATLNVVDPPEELRQRILAARASGVRTILPTPVPESLLRPMRRTGIVLAAAAILLIAAVVVMRPTELAAVAVDSELQLSPAQPQLGDSIRVTYKPAPGLFQRADSLILRARLRTPRDEMYSTGYMARQTRSVAVLRRVAGGAYQATLTLPDSFVFASLAVEDPGAERVDDHSGRLWEVLAHDSNGVPLYDAVNQRVNDMMGRSWEEAYASAKRLGELYPDRISGWTLREFFERALYGDAADSVSATYWPRLEQLIVHAKSSASISEVDMGTIFFRQRPRGAKATAADSAEFRYWWNRMTTEYPRHAQVAQHIAFRFRGAPALILDSLEAVYPTLAPLEGPGRNLFSAAFYAADQAKDHAAFRRWNERAYAGHPDSLPRMAVILAGRAPFRTEGMRTLRELLNAPATALGVPRSLTQNRIEHQQTVDDARRRLFVALGSALVADGRITAGLDTLRLAARGAWDIEVFRMVASAYLSAGDTASAMSARVRLAADPRTTPGALDSVRTAGRKYFGAAAWDSAVAAAQREMHERLLERSKTRSLRGPARLTTAAGKVVDLPTVTQGKPAVVIFWSRNCGGAIEKLPAITAAAERLHRSGTPVVLVVDEALTSDVAVYLTKRQWTLPVYHDIDGNVATAFASFSTPKYYVMDSAGRIRFDYAEDPMLLLAQVGALKPAANSAATGPDS